MKDFACMQQQVCRRAFHRQKENIDAQSTTV